VTSSQSSADPLLGPLDERLAAVKSEGRHRRARRHRVRTGIVAIAGASALLAGIAIVPSDPDVVTTDAAEARDGETPSTRPTEVLGMVIERDPVDDTTTVATDPPTSVTEAPPAPSATTTPTTATAPPGPCHAGPECGPFRWEPEPAANQPLTLTHDPVDPVPVGDTVVLTVHWADPDAPLGFVDDDTDGALLADACTIEPRYGAWVPPDPQGGAGSFTVSYTPEQTGMHAVRVFAATAACDGYHPYRSDQQLTIWGTAIE
jgi:hypothetical protein